MLLRRAMIVWAMAATTLPVTAAHAEEAMPEAPSPVFESSTSPAGAGPAVLPENARLDARPAGLTYKVDTRNPVPWPEQFRFDFAQPRALAPGIRLSPVAGAPGTGWAFSGRAGPFRWLTPISGDGGSTLRLGGQVPGQPRTPGLGNFNLSLHYAFE